MLKVQRPPLPADLQTVLDKWQQAVNTPNISLITPHKPSKTVKDLLHEWQTALDEQKSVKDLPWKAFQEVEKAAVKQLLETLTTIFHGKCAYCETKSKFEIEHYLPKSPHKTLNANQGSPAFMFQWDNLFLACTICNGFKYKGAAMKWRNGQPLLLNPCQDDPLDYLYIALNDLVKENNGLITAQPKQSDFGKERADYAITKLGLNEREYLVASRAEVVLNFKTLLESLIKFGLNYEIPSGYTIRQRLMQLLQPTKPYLAPLRQLFHVEPEIKTYLLEEIPELKSIINQWDLS